MVPGKVQTFAAIPPPSLGDEVDDIPEEFDSREVAMDGDSISTSFVIKDAAQVLPYCIITLTRNPPTSTATPS